MGMELDRLTISRVLSRQFQLTLEKGIRLEQSRDFAQLELLLQSVEEKKLTEHFRRDLNTYSPPQAFWLGGYGANGELVALVAARLDQLGSWNLERYWQEYWSRCYTGGDGSPVSFAKIQYQFSKFITGNVAYLGEMWVSDRHPEKAVSSTISKAVLLLALLEWDFDYCYAWTRPAFLKRGFAFNCGFAQVHPGIKWNRGPSTIDSDLKMMGNSKIDLVDLVDFLSSELPEE